MIRTLTRNLLRASNSGKFTHPRKYLLASNLQKLSFSTSKPRFQVSTKTHQKSSSNTLLFSLLAALTASATTYYLTRPTPETRSLVSEWTAPRYGEHAEFVKALTELRAALDNDRISIESEDLKRHGYSEWATTNIDTTPIVIAYPKSTEEVSRIAKICTKYRLPIVGYSGGSSLEGNFSAPHGGVCIDFINMGKILEIRPDDLDVTVQPGVGWVELNEVLDKDEKTKGLFFPVDPGPSSKIGGMVSTSCSGTQAVSYGPMRNHVISMTVVLADGTIIKTRGNGHPRKSSAGYNLNHLFSGAEGTLGLITEVTLRLSIVPEKITVACCPFPTVRDATAASSDLVRAGVPIHCVELMDPHQMKQINIMKYTPERKWTEQPTLLLKFSGSKSSVKEQIQQAAEIFAKHGSGSVGKFEFAKDDEEGAKLWAARKEALWSALALGPENAKSFATDVCVPISKLADLVEEVRNDFEGTEFESSTMGHVGDGNFHAGIIYNGAVPQQYEEAKKISHNVVYRGLALGGTCTGEHGIGLGKINYLVDELGPDTLDVMHTIKQALDPLNLLNPGKIFTQEAIAKGREAQNNGTFGPDHYKLYKFEKGRPGYLVDYKDLDKEVTSSQR